MKSFVSQLLTWRFLVQCLLTLALMVVAGLLLRAAGVGHDSATYVGIAIGAGIGGLLTPLWWSRPEGKRRS